MGNSAKKLCDSDHPNTLIDFELDGSTNKVKKLIINIKDGEGSSSSNAGSGDDNKMKKEVMGQAEKTVKLLSTMLENEAKGSGGEVKVDLKVVLHCLGCMRKIKNTIKKVEGVESISMDKENDIVTINGTMNVEDLLAYLQKKTKKSFEVVSVSKPKSEVAAEPSQVKKKEKPKEEGTSKSKVEPDGDEGKKKTVEKDLGEGTSKSTVVPAGGDGKKKEKVDASDIKMKKPGALKIKGNADE